jgi:hypothetical protein
MTSKIRHQESGSFVTIRNVWLEGKEVPIPRNPVSLYKNNINILLGLFLGKGTNMLLALLLALVLSHAVVLAYEEEGGGGHVLPPLARPDGFSLEDMARLMGQFTTSGNAGGINSPYQSEFDLVYRDDRTLKVRSTDIDRRQETEALDVAELFAIQSEQLLVFSVLPQNTVPDLVYHLNKRTTSNVHSLS